MIAEKWRCLVQRSPRRPGDLYDLWFYWDVLRRCAPRTADDVIDAAAVRRLVPRKVDLHDGRAEIVAALRAYAPVWANAVGDVLPADAPGFGEVEQAVLQAIRDWTPWR